MKNAEKILAMLDDLLEQPVELTLYGRAALSLGFPNSPDEYAWSKDVDGVLWIGQAEELAAHTNFWSAQEEVNRRLQEQGLFITHLFEENQVVLRPDWRANRVPVAGDWKYLRVFRLSDLDLILSKMMRNDPVDRQDILFILNRSGCAKAEIEQAIKQARVPEVSEIRGQFEGASRWLMTFFREQENE